MTHALRALSRLSCTTLLICGAACQGEATNDEAPRAVTSTPFGTAPDGGAVDLFTLRNASGVELALMTFGATIVSLTAPDRDGRFDDIVLGHDSLAGYIEESPYFGAVVGRYGNRIGAGTFELDGQTYDLAKNNPPNHLHGGLVGFDKVIWEAESFVGEDHSGVRLTYESADGEEGYPGALLAHVTYTLTDAGEVVVDYYATADKATPINLTQHSYFNLAGEGDILSHELMLNAGHYTPVDSTLIPTGEIRSVEGTPFDFLRPVAIGARIDQDDRQLLLGGGYDHNFVLDSGGDTLGLAARVVEPSTGRVLEVHTTEPGVQFYTGNFLDGLITGKDGRQYFRRSGFCLETQHFPDSPNKPDFPSTILRPGESYVSRTVFSFSVAP